MPASSDFCSGAQLKGAEHPGALGRLLVAPDADAQAEAWDGFVAKHSALLLRVAGSMGGGRDETMDRYAFVLERLRQDDFHRLRAYCPDNRAKFTTWLVVVARRLCLDQYRERYGRASSDESSARETVITRRRLQDLLGADPEFVQIADPSIPHPVDAMQSVTDGTVLHRALATLGPEDRLLLRLRFEDDLPAREIASLLRFPTPFHVYRRVNALLSALRLRLTNAGVEGPDQ